jgi:hypothetical protein
MKLDLVGFGWIYLDLLGFTRSPPLNPSIPALLRNTNSLPPLLPHTKSRWAVGRCFPAFLRSSLIKKIGRDGGRRIYE